MQCPHCDTLISDHEASRCLDAWVAEVVMDYYFKDEVLILKPPDEQPIRAEWFKMHSPTYSTDISAAWEIVNKYRMSVGPSILKHDAWCAMYGAAIQEHAKTASLAICRAAIKASHD